MPDTRTEPQTARYEELRALAEAVTQPDGDCCCHVCRCDAHDRLRAALRDTPESPVADWPAGHEFLPPPHPDGQYISSALCSCGQWQWDGESEYHARGPESFTDWQRHATASTTPREEGPADVCLNCNGTGWYRLDGAQRVCLWDHGEKVEFPHGYDHRPECSQRHPVTFPCDNGTPTPQAVIALRRATQSGGPE